ncbi:hypothetical protein BG262_07880 [Floricoccus penangensis]|uniref:GTP cyclohydrolase n=1 Tax=Floricoccus penangensis TaxID=1859475 RepID=A0A9Q5JI03_9LACT|nr:DUF960 domain-containing protein [Floricoccus penangensis]OFI47901.1 hypothetical protein BG262_07880 [Floricoccus penangensis]
MAFTNTSGRYASFGIASELPGQIIDSFWYIIDNNLKGVFVLEPIINFELINNDGYLTILFSQEGSYDKIAFDFDFPYDKNWPKVVHVVDRMGRETVILPSEM